MQVHNSPEDIDSRLRDRLIVTIASAYPFSIEDVRVAYDTTGSFDATIQACETALKLGGGGLLGVIRLIRYGPGERVDAPLFPKLGPSETK